MRKRKSRKKRETQEEAEKAEAVLSSVMLLDNKPGSGNAKHTKKPECYVILLLGQPWFACKTVCAN